MTAPPSIPMRGSRWCVAAVVIVVLAAVLAAAWLWERWFALEIIGVAALLALSVGRSGWRGEAQILATVALALAGAFHWAPTLLAGAMQTHWTLGVLAATPFVLWDAARVSLPFWCVARLVRDPRDAWLPATLAARLFTPTGLAAIAVAVANAIFGGWALAYHERLMAAAPQIDVALVQFDPGQEGATDTLRRLSREAIAARSRPAARCSSSARSTPAIARIRWRSTRRRSSPTPLRCPVERRLVDEKIGILRGVRNSEQDSARLPHKPHSLGSQRGIVDHEGSLPVN